MERKKKHKRKDRSGGSPHQRTCSQTRTVVESRTGSGNEHHSTVFVFPRGVFSNIQAEVETFMRTLLQLSVENTHSLTYAILTDVMRQVTSILSDLCDPTSSFSCSLARSTGKRTAEELVISTGKKMQQFWHLSTVSSWINDSQGSPVNVADAVDAYLSRLATDALSTYFQSLLSICSEGTSADVQGFDADTPLCSFVQAMADSIKGFSNSARPKPSASGTGTKGTVHLPASGERRCERILEMILFSDVEDYDLYSLDVAKLMFWLPFGLSWETLQAEASTLIRDIILSETSKIAASSPHVRVPPAVCAELERCSLSASYGVVVLLSSELAAVFDQEFVLPDPSVDPARYEAQVKQVSGKLLEVTRAKLQEALQTDLLVRSRESLSINELAFLTSTLLTSSKEVVKSAVLGLREFVPRSLLTEALTSDPAREFLKSLKQQLDLMYVRTLSDTSGLDEETFRDLITADPRALGMVAFAPKRHSTASKSVCSRREKGETQMRKDEETPRKRSRFQFLKIRMPKLKFKKWRKKVTPVSVPSTTCTQERLPPPGTQHQSSPTPKNPSSSQTDGTDVSPPKTKKSFLSRLSGALSRVFGKLRKTSVC